MQTIYLDISNKGVIPTINAKQGDVGRKFLAVITDNGTTLSGLENPVFSVWYEGDSGSGNYSSIDDRPAVVFDGKNATVELATQMLTNAGDGEITLVMNDSNGYQIGVWNIDYSVEAVKGMDSQEVENYYTALSETASQAIDAAARAEKAAANFEVDKTLTKEGQAADAKAAGDRIASVEANTNNKLPRELVAGLDYGEQFPEDAAEGKLFFVPEIPANDFVLEAVTDGDWRYRKWNSGLVECWGNHAVNSGEWTEVATGIRYTADSVYIYLPEGLFSSVEAANATARSGGVVCPLTTGFSTERIATRFLRVLGGTEPLTVNVSVYIVGQWK